MENLYHKNKIQLLYFFLFIILSLVPACKTEIVKQDTLYVVKDLNTYNDLVKKDSNISLIDLEKYIPDIKLDIRYATENNFTKQKVYNQPKAYLRLPAANALKNVQAELKKYGYGIKIFDAYRPYSATVKFWELVHDPVFVASPKHGSRHNRGCAVDLSLIDLKTGKELEMPTDFDNFTDKASAFYINDLSEKAIKNRKLLQDLMTKNNFMIYEGEWWHFDFSEWKKFDVTDIEFSQL